MKQFSILLLILICTQTAYSQTLTRLARVAKQAHSATRSLHIPPKTHHLNIHSKYNINEQDETTQVRAALLQEAHDYKEALDDIRHTLIEAYREDKNIRKAEEFALQRSASITVAHYERIKELNKRLEEIEKKKQKK